jgi:hypothetical protein
MENNKSIEEIWPDAYKTNQPCQLVGYTTQRGLLTKAWFRCRDGRTFALSKEELLSYDPDLKVSKTYKKPKK